LSSQAKSSVTIDALVKLTGLTRAATAVREREVVRDEQH